jgi:hypothetical protein
MTTIQKTAIVLLLSAAIGVAVFETRQNSKIAKENRDLREEVSNAAKFAKEVRDSRQRELVSADELRRLRAAQSEALRLRDEIGQLRRSLASSSNGVPTQETWEKPIFPLPFLNFTTKTSSKIKSGETLITGGWPADDGGRTFMLLTLERPKTDSDEFLTFHTAVFDLNDQMANDMGLTSFVNDGSDSTPSSLVDTDEAGASAWVAELKSTKGVRVDSTPTIATKVGDKAVLSVGNYVPVSEGNYTHVGRKITLVPSNGPSGLEVSLKTEITKLSATP